jgi:ribonuclease P protein component
MTWKPLVFHNFFHRCGKLWEETPTEWPHVRYRKREADRRMYHTPPSRDHSFAGFVDTFQTGWIRLVVRPTVEPALVRDRAVEEDCDEAYVSTQQSPAAPDAWISGSYAHQEWSHRAETSSRQRAKAPDGFVELTGSRAGRPASNPYGVMPDQRFREHQHIRRRSEYQQVYDRGRKHQGRAMIVFTLPRPDAATTRLGIAATRKLGGAVERNRAKRLVRELFRRHPAPAGFDIVVVPRRALFDATFSSLETEYVATLGRLAGSRGR